MGCHTWFQNQWEFIPNTDIKSLIEKYNEEYEYIPNKNPTFKEYQKSMQSYYNEYIKDENYDMAKYLKPRMNSRAWWKKDIYRKNSLYRKINKRKISRHELINVLRKLDWINYPNKYYNVPTKYSDNFRIYDYNAKPWYSVEDFENYIKDNPKTEIRCFEENIKNPYEYALNIVKEFFKTYPHGRIMLA